MGYNFNSTCYTTNAEAADAYFLSASPAFTSGSTSYLSWFEKVSNVWQIKRQSIAANGTVSNLNASTATVPAFPTCTQSQNFLDGVTLGWGVAAAMIAAFAVKFLARGLSR